MRCSKKNLFIGAVFSIFIILTMPCIGTYNKKIQIDKRIDEYIFREFRSKKSITENVQLHEIEIGDILFMDVKPILSKVFPPLKSHLVPGEANDHVAMYIGNSIFIEANYYGIEKYLEEINIFYFQNIFSNEKDGVRKTPFIVFWLWGTNFKIGKVNTTNEIKMDAVTFALEQIGKPYQWVWSGGDERPIWHVNPNITDPENPFFEKYNYQDDITIDRWYCSELVWAAYLHQGINIDAYPDPDLNNSNNNESYYYVGPDNIKFSEQVNIYNLKMICCGCQLKKLI
jgi:uncharacterized protein YycO